MNISRPGARVASPFSVHDAASVRLLAEHPRTARHVDDGKAQSIMGVSRDGCEAGRRSPRKATGRWWLISYLFFFFPWTGEYPHPWLLLSCLVLSCAVAVSLCLCLCFHDVGWALLHTLIPAIHCARSALLSSFSRTSLENTHTTFLLTVLLRDLFETGGVT